MNIANNDGRSGLAFCGVRFAMSSTNLTPLRQAPHR